MENKIVSSTDKKHLGAIAEINGKSVSVNGLTYYFDKIQFIGNIKRFSNSNYVLEIS